MKKVLISLVGLLALGVVAHADSYTYTYTSTANSTNLSSAIPVSGLLDKIEMYNAGSAVTTTVTVATYNGTTAIETFATKALSGSQVVRTRVLPTDNTGTSLAAAFSALGTGTNASQVLTIPYERPMLGGNTKINIVNAHANASAVTVVIYYERLKK